MFSHAFIYLNCLKSISFKEFAPARPQTINEHSEVKSINHELLDSLLLEKIYCAENDLMGKKGRNRHALFNRTPTQEARGFFSKNFLAL